MCRIISSKPFRYLKDRIVDQSVFLTVIPNTSCLMGLLLLSDSKNHIRREKRVTLYSIKKITVFGLRLPMFIILLLPLKGYVTLDNLFNLPEFHYFLEITYFLWQLCCYYNSTYLVALFMKIKFVIMSKKNRHIESAQYFLLLSFLCLVLKAVSYVNIQTLKDGSQNPVFHHLVLIYQEPFLLPRLTGVTEMLLLHKRQQPGVFIEPTPLSPFSLYVQRGKKPQEQQ